MRKDKNAPRSQYYNDGNQPTCSINGTIYIDDSCNTSQYNELDKTGTYIFTSCEWNECTGLNGAAIYIATSDVDLEVSNCKFISCVASKNGSGIYAHFVSVVHVRSSLFYNCETQGTNSNDGGGGIWVFDIPTEVLIIATDFIGCLAMRDGAGVNLWNSNSTNGNAYSFQACRFIQCIGCDEGGGISAWDNKYNVCVHSTLFCECSGRYGGAFAMSLMQPLTEVIPFCFFLTNSVYNGYIRVGNEFPNNEDFLLHSLCAFGSQILYYWTGRNWVLTDANWLITGKVITDVYFLIEVSL